MNKSQLRRNAIIFSQARTGQPYKEVLEYIESTGTQYIDTGIIANSETKIDISLASATSGGTHSPIGARDRGGGDSPNTFVIWSSEGTLARFDYTSTTRSTVYSTNVLSIGVKYNIVKDKELNFIDGVANTSNNDATFTCSYPLYLFAINQGGTAFGYFEGKIFNVRIWINGVLVRDMIPVLDWNDVPCIYDRVSKKLYYNSGTGTFTYKRWNKTTCDWLKNISRIASSASYIDTGIPTADNVGIRTIHVPFDGADSIVIGSRGTYAQSRLVINTSVNTLNLSWNTMSRTESPITLLTKYDAKLNYKNNRKRIVNGVEKENITETLNTSNNFNICLFAAYWGTTTPSLFFIGKVCLAEVTIDNDIVRSLIPTVDENGVACMYDAIYNKMYYNAGGGAFVAGFTDKNGIDYVAGSYLESTGTQYINTGITPTQDTKVEIRFSYSTFGGFVYGSRTNANDTSIDKHCLLFQNNATIYPQFYSDAASVLGSCSTNTIYATSNGKDGFYINGELIKSYSYSDFTSTLPMYLFGLNQNGSLESRTFMGKIYYAKIINKKKVQRVMVPVTRQTDSVASMYDTVKREFLPNAGTGEFTMGATT